jgi:hypothetical protein
MSDRTMVTFEKGFEPVLVTQLVAWSAGPEFVAATRERGAVGSASFEHAASRTAAERRMKLVRIWTPDEALNADRCPARRPGVRGGQ